VGARGKLGTLPLGIRAWLDQELRERGFGDYERITRALNERLESHYAAGAADPAAPSAPSVGTSTVHRYGQRLQRRIERIIASTQAAQMIADAAPDEAAAQSAAVIGMVQGDIFEVLLQLQEVEEQDDPGKRLKLLGDASKAIAELSHAAIRQKQWSSQVRAKLDAAKAAAADAAEAVARKAGLSEDDWGAIRAQILGIEVAA
jgi:hypothetical protein